MTPSFWVWLASGAPASSLCEETPGARCWVCAGQADRSMSRSDWMGASYTGQNRVACPSSDRICEPCVLVHSRTFPVLGRPAKDGKQPPNWRNFSVLCEVADGAPVLLTASKGEKHLIRDWLRRPKSGPWFAGIADSGQKHIIPNAPMNATAGRAVLFEESVVTLPRPEDPMGWPLLNALCEILTQGGTKEGLATGQHTAYAFRRLGGLLLAFEEDWGPLRHSPWWTLALWLAQRDEVRAAALEKENTHAHKAAKGGPAKPVGQPDLGDPQAISEQRRERPQALGPDPGGAQERGAAVRDGRGLDQPPVPSAPAGRPGQLALF